MIWTFWLYAVCAMPWLGCLLTYGLRSPRRPSLVRTAMLVTYASLSGVLVLAAVLRLVHPPFDVALALAAATLAAVCVAGWVQLATILRLQRRDPSATLRRRSTDL